MATTTTASARPASCDPSTTATTGIRRLWRPPRKSPTPHERLAARPSAMANMARHAGILCADEPACTDRRRRERVGHVPARARAGGQDAHAVVGDRHRAAAQCAPLPATALAECALARPARPAACRSRPLLRPEARLQRSRAPHLARLPDVPRRLWPDRLRRSPARARALGRGRDPERDRGGRAGRRKRLRGAGGRLVPRRGHGAAGGGGGTGTPQPPCPSPGAPSPLGGGPGGAPPPAPRAPPPPPGAP